MMLSTFLKPLFLAFCFLILLPAAYSQGHKRDSTIQFPNEIGVDFAPFIRGQTGVSVLIKHNIGPTKIAKWQKRTSVRALLGKYSETVGSGGFIRSQADTFYILDSHGDAHRYFINGGIERQLSRRKLRFYFGCDLGYRGSSYKGTTQKDVHFPGGSLPYDSWQGEVKTNGTEVSIFAGGNFFFWPRFSIGLELNSSMGIEFSNSKVIRNGQVATIDKNTTFVGNTSIPRLLYLSWHF